MQGVLKYECVSCTDKDKAVRGCSLKASTVVMAHGVKGFATRCPVIDAAEISEYFRVFSYWNKGEYPNSGTWADQPNRLVLMMENIGGQTTTNENPDNR